MSDFFSLPRAFQSFLPTFSILISLSFLWTCQTIDPLPNYNLKCDTLIPTKNGFTITGESINDKLGYPVSTAGDINNDGYADILVGAYRYKANSGKGAVYVIYGGPTSDFLNIDLGSTILDPATTGFIITGFAAGNYFGWSAKSAGDINKDGYDDIIIGAYGYSGSKGAAYVIYGGKKSAMSNIDLSLTPLNPATTGFTILGNLAADYLGASVDRAGDVDNDGYGDIIIGASRAVGTKGAAYMIYGGPKTSLPNLDLNLITLNPSTTGFMITGSAAGDLLGYSVSTAGDLNKDGYDDIIVGAYGKSLNTGIAYVIYGGPRGAMSSIDFSLIPTALDPHTTGFIMTGESSNNYFGYSVSTAGDINKDGYDDIIIGATGRSGFKGAAYVIYGGEKTSMSNLDFSVPANALNPLTTGFMITGSAAGDFLGYSVSTAGDLNKDGFADIIVGAYGPSGNTGAAYVIYGGKKSSMSNIDFSLTALYPATTGFTILGSAANDYLGISVDTVGDINKDGYDDIIVGAYQVNGNRGRAYVIHNACLTANCDSCISRSVCKKCTSPYLLFDSFCLPACPTRTYSSNNLCNDCPIHCSSCTSQESCQTCDEGYTLLNSLCAAPSSLHTKSSSLRTISSATRGIGSVVSVGGSMFPLTALVSKIVQNTRYMNLTVTNELAEIYQTWDTDLISWDVPNALAKFNHFETAPAVFARYEVDSPFLVNFWPTIVNIAIGLAAFATCFGLQELLKRSEFNKGWISAILPKLILGSFNFTLIQAYACLDDILFYLVLDSKTNPFNTFFCWVSLFFAIGFLALGCFLAWLNIKTVREYQALKSDTTALEAFNEKNKNWGLFYSDFSDEDLWSQSALVFFLARSTLSSLIIAVLYEYPQMQNVYLIIIDGVGILFIYFKKPFTTFQSTLCQYFYEIITLLVHICTCSLSMQNPSDDGGKRFLSDCIIYLNTALVTGSIGFMFIEIYKTLRQKLKHRKKYEEIASQTFSHRNLNLRDTPAYALATSHKLKQPQTEPKKWQHPFKKEQVAPLEDFHLCSDVTQENNNSFTGVNLQPINQLNSSMNADDSVSPNNETMDQIIEPRPQNTALRVIRPRIRKVRINQE